MGWPDYVKLSTAQIGRCGELLVQFRFLRLGIESAPMCTDTGIDLVAYAPSGTEPQTIQVKTNLKPKPGGGKGKSALEWWVRQDCPAQLIALADLSLERAWMFHTAELSTLAQQKPTGRIHLYTYTDPTARSRRGLRATHVYDFERYALENHVHVLFGT